MYQTSAPTGAASPSVDMTLNPTGIAAPSTVLLPVTEVPHAYSSAPLYKNQAPTELLTTCAPDERHVRGDPTMNPTLSMTSTKSPIAFISYDAP